MATLKAMELENGQWVYMQVDENVTFPDIPTETPDDNGFEHKGIKEQAKKAVDNIGDLIRSMSDTAAKALEDSAFGNASKITLEFGIKLGGETGIPYIANGKAEGSVNVKVEFSPKEKQATAG
jgi:hypothetical protein